jgi:hypothetical protein
MSRRAIVTALKDLERRGLLGVWCDHLLEGPVPLEGLDLLIEDFAKAGGVACWHATNRRRDGPGRQSRHK